MISTLILKLVLVPVLIGAVSLAGRRWGPAVSGWLVGLPLTSAPVALFLALEQGPAFAARAAQGTLMGLVSVAAFCLVYSRLVRRIGWPGSLLGGWTAFFVATFALEQVSVPLALAFAGVTAALLVAMGLLPESPPQASGAEPPPWEIPLRMVAATAMVLAITGAAESLGPQLSGLLTPFPVYATVLAAFTHQFQGPSAAIRLLGGVVAGSFSFAVFFLIVAWSVERSLAGAFGLAILVALTLHGITFWLLRARMMKP